MGGQLWAVQNPIKNQGKIMVCGIDVYHDPARHGRSVVGFVASTNATMTSWYSRAKFLKQSIEMVDTMHICLMECLKKYFETYSYYPRNILIFRNSVSDRQLSFCAEHEAPKLLSAIQSLVPKPKFIMVVVQKRTNARFFRDTPNGLVNPSPGTVIDHTVTRRDWWDYFLVSSNRHLHKGTVTPTHYVVVHDGGMKSDTLQELTFRLTMMYYNWYGPIRVPAPCLYAHKLAHLVGEYIRKNVKEELCDRLFFL